MNSGFLNIQAFRASINEAVQTVVDLGVDKFDGIIDQTTGIPFVLPILKQIISLPLELQLDPNSLLEQQRQLFVYEVCCYVSDLSLTDREINELPVEHKQYFNLVLEPVLGLDYEYQLKPELTTLPLKLGSYLIDKKIEKVTTLEQVLLSLNADTSNSASSSTLLGVEASLVTNLSAPLSASRVINKKMRLDSTATTKHTITSSESSDLGSMSTPLPLFNPQSFTDPVIDNHRISHCTTGTFAVATANSFTASNSNTQDNTQTTSQTLPTNFQAFYQSVEILIKDHGANGYGYMTVNTGSQSSICPLQVEEQQLQCFADKVLELSSGVIFTCSHAKKLGDEFIRHLHITSLTQNNEIILEIKPNCSIKKMKLELARELLLTSSDESLKEQDLIAYLPESIFPYRNDHVKKHLIRQIENLPIFEYEKAALIGLQATNYRRYKRKFKIP